MTDTTQAAVDEANKWDKGDTFTLLAGLLVLFSLLFLTWTYGLTPFTSSTMLILGGTALFFVWIADDKDSRTKRSYALRSSAMLSLGVISPVAAMAICGYYLADWVGIVASLVLSGALFYSFKKNLNDTFKAYAVLIMWVCLALLCIFMAGFLVPHGRLIYTSNTVRYISSFELLPPWEHQKPMVDVELAGTIATGLEKLDDFRMKIEYSILDPATLLPHQWASYLGFQATGYVPSPEVRGAEDSAEAGLEEFLRLYPFLEAKVEVWKTIRWQASSE